MINHSWDFSYYLRLLCLMALFTVHPGVYASSSTAVIIKPHDLNLNYPSLVDSLYKNHQEQRFWEDKSLRTELEKQVELLVLADISDDFSRTYQSLQISAARHEWLRYDYIASDLLLFYLAYTEQVAIKGKSWLFANGIRNNIDAPSTSAVNAFFNAPTYLQRLTQLQKLSTASLQQTALYKKLLAFQEDNNIAAAKFTASAKKGEQLKQKEILLARLQIAGDLSAEMKTHFKSEDKNLYSDQLREIIIAFQKRHGLKGDGIIGKNTRYWLNLSHQARIKLMALNILRLQLGPQNISQAVIVNIPDYKMAYWEKGENLFESNVIVGRKDRKTVLFSTRLDSIVFNPTWNVPVSIMRQDILPKALVNADYLQSHRYEILSDWQSKEVISPEQIDWSTITANNFPYKLRQSSGKKNALGLYKFNMPNKYAIYLHDTPSKYLFKNKYRAYSSGCVRVQKSAQFMQFLMEKSGYSAAQYTTLQQQTETRVMPLKEIITVYIIYKTVWVDPQGTTQFRKDIYSYDTLNK